MGMDETRGIADFTVKKTLPKKTPTEGFRPPFTKGGGVEGQSPRRTLQDGKQRAGGCHGHQNQSP